jgi:Excalibur calcium-binding domain
MLIIAAILAITPIESVGFDKPIFEAELSLRQKKRRATSGKVRRFSSCKAARKAGYTHMRRGQPGYSGNLDRDGDGVACDKMR